MEEDVHAPPVNTPCDDDHSCTAINRNLYRKLQTLEGCLEVSDPLAVEIQGLVNKAYPDLLFSAIVANDLPPSSSASDKGLPPPTLHSKLMVHPSSMSTAVAISRVIPHMNRFYIGDKNDGIRCWLFFFQIGQPLDDFNRDKGQLQQQQSALYERRRKRMSKWTEESVAPENACVMINRSGRIWPIELCEEEMTAAAATTRGNRFLPPHFFRGTLLDGELMDGEPGSGRSTYMIFDFICLFGLTEWSMRTSWLARQRVIETISSRIRFARVSADTHESRRGGRMDDDDETILVCQRVDAIR